MDAQALISALRDRARKFVSLDTPEDADLGDMAIDIGAGFVPGVGQAQAGRDFERARREGDRLGMVLSAAGMVPVVGGVAGAANKARKGAKATEETVKALRVGPRAEALEVARQNAVKMLGLPENNTAMDRAKALGFEEGWYHGTFNDVPAFDIGRVKDRFPYSIGVHVTNRPSEASIYAQKSPADKSTIVDGANVMPLMARRGNAMNIDTKQVAASMEADLNRAQIINELVKAKNSGAPYDSVVINRSRGDEWDGANLITRDPSRLRSRFAAFDPARVKENDLLGRADPRLLAGIAAGGLGTAAAVAALRNRKQEEEEEATR